MAEPSDREQVLDNPVWHALRGPQRTFARPSPDAPALRFDPEVGMFGAVEETDAQGWSQLGELVRRDGFAVLFRDEIPTCPPGLIETFRDVGWQLVADDLPAPPDLALESLGAKDADEMLALTQLTEPGPFFPRTVELGGYVGVRQDGRLIAMAGRRMRPPGYCEISAVCTHPDARRRGLGAALTLHVAREIRRAGDEAFLHVLASNVAALRLYETLGFRRRRRIEVVVVAQEDSADGSPEPAAG